MNPTIGVQPARFQHHHACRRILAQPYRDHTVSEASADNNEISFQFSHRFKYSNSPRAARVKIRLPAKIAADFRHCLHLPVVIAGEA